MNAILTQLIADAINADKIPSLDCFDMSGRDKGFFILRLNDGTTLKITVEQVETA